MMGNTLSKTPLVVGLAHKKGSSATPNRKKRPSPNV